MHKEFPYGEERQPPPLLAFLLRNAHYLNLFKPSETDAAALRHLYLRNALYTDDAGQCPMQGKAAMGEASLVCFLPASSVDICAEH